MLHRNISQFSNNPKRYFRRTIIRNLPRVLTYIEVVSISLLVSLLPALSKIFDEPYVFSPTIDDYDVLKVKA